MNAPSSSNLLRGMWRGLGDVWRCRDSEPHRIFFAAGVTGVIFMSLWWAGALGFNAVTAYPATMVHAVLMPLGVFPLFMMGFIFTAGPRWLQTSPPRRHGLLAPLYLLGLVLALPGFTLGAPWPAPGLTLMLVSWFAATALWASCVRRSEVDDRRHAKRLLVVMLGGCLALGVTLAWALFARSAHGAAMWVWARQLSLWAFIVPVFLIVCHRMIPFFTHSALPQVKAWRPFYLLDGWLLACLVLALMAPADVELPWSRLQAMTAFAMAVALALASWRWNLYAATANRLLFMLHLSFAWLPLALGLHALALSGVAVGSAPSHALALGFCATMLVAFVTRVSLGHSGRALVADRGYWAIYLALHVVAALRVLIALAGLSLAWLHAVSGLWVLLMVAWAARVLPIYWRGRIPKPA
ncbi:NnrS family protein [Uliginosibacterium sp. H3]|uniref:NnrS family protein n=1 Tax=Uliginosibacterium silvisoli TaxID=3114758 RepID=A0ABU6K5S5_9RHOO|nr:NnrS family protein [Uliginosibacterium sp. H3]